MVLANPMLMLYILLIITSSYHHIITSCVASLSHCMHVTFALLMYLTGVAIYYQLHSIFCIHPSKQPFVLVKTGAFPKLNLSAACSGCSLLCIKQTNGLTVPFRVAWW